MTFLTRYISNKFTQEDLQKTTKALTDEKTSPEVTATMKQHWELIDDQSDINDQVDFEGILAKVHHQINLLHQTTPIIRDKQIQIWALIGKIAALIVLPISIASIYFSMQYNTSKSNEMTFKVSAGKGQQSQLVLSDGSEVWLNSESSIEYSSNFGQHNRQLKLTGEAYFQVAKNKKLPFVVNASQISVTAVGTAFNVDAYKDDLRVTLVEGIVKVESPLDTTVLNPGEQLLCVNSKFTTNNVDAELFTSWHQGVLIFKNELLIDITNQLEKKYDVEFIFQDDSLRNFRYRGRLKLDYSIFKSLEMLRLSTGLNYEIKGRTIILKSNPKQKS